MLTKKQRCLFRCLHHKPPSQHHPAQSATLTQCHRCGQADDGCPQGASDSGLRSRLAPCGPRKVRLPESSYTSGWRQAICYAHLAPELPKPLFPQIPPASSLSCPDRESESPAELVGSLFKNSFNYSSTHHCVNTLQAEAWQAHMDL